MSLSAEDVRAISETSARAAVKEWLTTLGINADDPHAITNLQKDFAYVRSWRMSIETVRTQTLRSAVAVVVTGLLGMAYMLFKGWH